MARTISEIAVDDRGRVVLPASVRSELGLKPGTRLLLSTDEEGSLRLRPYRAVADACLGIFSDLAPDGVSLADELIAERRAEAALALDPQP
jgi:AbrB family looped-hinge helix DNA binding protein